MSIRVPRNQVDVLNQAHKEMLKTMKHFNETRPYKVAPSDLSPKYGAYSTVLARLYRLEQSDWIVIHRDNKRIRGIDVLALP